MGKLYTFHFLKFKGTDESPLSPKLKLSARPKLQISKTKGNTARLYKFSECIYWSTYMLTCNANPIMLLSFLVLSNALCERHN